MVANIRGFTPNYGFKLINFDTPRWHTLEYANWSLLDSMFLQLGTPPIRGEWLNSTMYIAGDRVFDPDTSELYRCAVTHTSAASGTFTADRAAHPTYWTIQSIGVPVFRGTWAPASTYATGDIVVYSSYAYYLCTYTHLSSAAFPSDSANWALVFDATSTVADTVAARDAAAASAASATASQTASSNSATAASGSATTATTAATTATTKANEAATSATNANNSALEAANQAAALRGTSLSSNSISLGAKTFTTQASKQFNVGNWMTIVSTASTTNFIAGFITAYSGTTLTLNCVRADGFGTFADWQLYISGAVGVAGLTGGGSSSIVISATPPSSPQHGMMWWESDTGSLYIYYDDGDSAQWVVAFPQPDASAFALKSEVTTVAATAFDAMAYSGMQINGGMDINQEKGATPSTVFGTYVVDGWKFSGTGTMAVSWAQQSAPVGSLLFRNYVTMSVSTALASITGSDYMAMFQWIEGYRMARLNWGGADAQPITIGFWTAHTRTGLHSVSIRNAALNRSIVATYTQNVSAVFEYKTVTFPGCTDGVWAADNTSAAMLMFVVASGPTLATSTLNTWLSSSVIAATGQVNGVASTSDFFRLTGVTVLPGTQAPTAARSPFVMRPYDQELEICQRYYLGYYGGTVGFFGSGTYIQTTVWFNQPMRAAPTITGNAGVLATMDWSAASNVNPSSNSIQQLNVNTQSAEFRINNYTGLTLGQAGVVQPQNQAICKFDARL